MEGSRHERVALIGATYAIGFVTAFIAFGVSQMEESVEFVYVPSESQPAALVVATEKESPVTLTMMADGLYYKVGKSELLLSAVSDSGGTDGQAAAIIQYELSPDGTLVYFCEQPVAEVDACKPFIYQVETETVFPLTQAGERIALPNKTEALLWDETGLVAIGDIAVDPLPVI